MKKFTRTVWFLSFISLFTDMASEMLYPVMPVYLKSIGYSIVVIGILEGFAEAIAGLSKGYFGKLSDSTGKRVPFVQWGYILSAISKPIMGLQSALGIIFLSRATDRLGKGIRTGARDAMLALDSTPETRGSVFGLHRAIDTAGAVIGPSLALLFLNQYPGQYADLFLWAFIPGAVAVAISFALKEKKTKITSGPKVNFFSFTGYWKTSTPEYRKLVGPMLVFAIVNSSDIFLLLMMKENGATDQQVIGIYIFYNLVYAIASYPLGALADKIGLKKMLVAGLFLFALVYGGMAFADNNYLFLALFALYGIYAAATEGISKALISLTCKKEDTATAIGAYTAYQSIAALLASTLAGLIWHSCGPEIVFLYGAIVSIAVALWLVKGLKNFNTPLSN